LTHVPLSIRAQLMKGKWRPRLQQFVDSLEEGLVRSTTQAAFKQAAAGKVVPALETLSGLKGVGPATASAILSALRFEVPFMSDEALNACKGPETGWQVLEAPKRAGVCVPRTQSPEPAFPPSPSPLMAPLFPPHVPRRSSCPGVHPARFPGAAKRA
jgi:hypothetical protein